MDKLQSLELLDGRFRDISLVNVTSVERRGCFSLVFRATDVDTNLPVALKFFDPARLGDVYRHTCFQREHEILKQLLHVNHCLQLVSGFNTFNLPIPVAPGITLRCDYFALEWIDDDIDDYFLRQEEHSSIEKLILFMRIVSSVGVLHSRSIFHRDLKRDNLRIHVRGGRPQVVPIDMGTAARLSSAPLQQPYQFSVGALGYAAPEAQCGFAGHRKIARYTDLYALGCMLFELFNRDYFFVAFESVNRHWAAHYAALASQIDFKQDERTQVHALCSALNKMSGAFVRVRIDGAGSSVPPGIAPILSDVLGSLTHVDFRQRPESVEWIQRRIASAIKVMRNDRLYRQRLEQRKKQRLRRIENLRLREERLRGFLQKQVKDDHA